MKSLQQVVSEVSVGANRAKANFEMKRLAWIPKIFKVLRWFNIQICNIGNIPTIVHWSTVLMFLFLLVTNPAAAVLYGVVFLSVIPHEYGHIFAAKWYGIDTSHVVIYPIGGMAFLKRMSKKPIEEFIIASAGPLVSLTLSGIGLLGWQSLNTPSLAGFGIVVEGHQIIVPSAFWFNFFALNLALVIFNLIPAFPMDGGRILRAFLSRFFGLVRGTFYSVRISQIISLPLLIYGIFITNFSLTFIPIFVMMAAEAELCKVVAEEKLAEKKEEDEKV